MPSKSYPRSRRVAQQLQRTLSEIMRRELRDPRLGMVTLTEVRMSGDLAYATVYYAGLGADAREAQDSRDEAASLLRGPGGRAFGLRHSRELRFVKDALMAGGARLSALISQAVKDDEARHVDDEAERDSWPATRGRWR